FERWGVEHGAPPFLSRRRFRWGPRADAPGAPRAGGPIAGRRGRTRSPARERRRREQVRLERGRDRAHRRPHARATPSAGPDVLLAHAGYPPSRAGSPAADAVGAW